MYQFSKVSPLLNLAVEKALGLTFEKFSVEEARRKDEYTRGVHICEFSKVSLLLTLTEEMAVGFILEKCCQAYINSEKSACHRMYWRKSLWGLLLRICLRLDEETKREEDVTREREKEKEGERKGEREREREKEREREREREKERDRERDVKTREEEEDTEVVAKAKKRTEDNERVLKKEAEHAREQQGVSF